MQLKDKHIIQGKWVDCKSAIPIAEMRAIELSQEVDQDISLEKIDQNKNVS